MRKAGCRSQGTPGWKKSPRGSRSARAAARVESEHLARWVAVFVVGHRAGHEPVGGHLDTTLLPPSREDRRAPPLRGEDFKRARRRVIDVYGGRMTARCGTQPGVE